jgi:hypothetical protein
VADLAGTWQIISGVNTGSTFTVSATGTIPSFSIKVSANNSYCWGTYMAESFTNESIAPNTYTFSGNKTYSYPAFGSASFTGTFTSVLQANGTAQISEGAQGITGSCSASGSDTWSAKNLSYTSSSSTPVSYIDNGNGTVTSSATGLIWQKQDDGTRRTWDAANSYCSGLSLDGTGWRLPTKDELLTIVNTSYDPSIDPIFTNTQRMFYWSSTTDATIDVMSALTAWAVPFGSPNDPLDFGHGYDFYVRCVR